MGNKIRFLFVGVLVMTLIFFSYLSIVGLKDYSLINKATTKFLTYASENEPESAYNMTSSEFRGMLSKEDFASLLGKKAQFSGFASQKQTGFNVEKKPKEPLIYNYSATIFYDDGEEGKVEMRFVKENGKYKILYFEVQVPLSRVARFL